MKIAAVICGVLMVVALGVMVYIQVVFNLYDGSDPRAYPFGSYHDVIFITTTLFLLVSSIGGLIVVFGGLILGFMMNPDEAPPIT